jgi:DNA-binding LacI/PurR family transcriptional regulator
VGYDDIALASWVTPALTTIHQPLRRMAERATEMVLGMARGKTVKVEQIDLATHLVVRDTTAPPCC